MMDRRGEWLFLIPQDADPADPLTLARAMDMKGHPNRRLWRHRMEQYEDFVVLGATTIGSLPAIRVGADLVTNAGPCQEESSAITADTGIVGIAGTPTTAKEMA